MRASRFIVAALVLLAGIAARGRVEALMHMATESTAARQQFADFPSTVGPWQVTLQTLTERELELLYVDDYLLADFTDESGGYISLYVGYYKNPDRATQHPPKICYPGSGYVVADETMATLEVGDGQRPLAVNQILFEKDRQRELVIYWYNMSGYTGASPSWQKLLRVKRLLSGRPSLGASKFQIALRMDTTVEATQRQLEEFLSELLPVLDRFIPQDTVDGS